MYFSLITPIPGQERQAAYQWATTDAYAEHQWLWHFFPSPEGTARDFLFRRRDQEGIPRFYVVSHRPPEFCPDAWEIQQRDYQPALAQGDLLEFELRANPVVTHSRTGKRQRHDVIVEAKKALLAEQGLSQWTQWQNRPALHALIREHAGLWLQKRGEANGFTLIPEALQVDAYTQHRAKNGQLRFSTVDFKGVLQVDNPELFVQNALMQGIGHAKAFGCGLMLIRRI